MGLGLTCPPLADSMMLTLTSHYTATNAKHHRYAAANPPDQPGRQAYTAHRSDPGTGRRRGRQPWWCGEAAGAPTVVVPGGGGPAGPGVPAGGARAAPGEGTRTP